MCGLYIRNISLYPKVTLVKEIYPKNTICKCFPLIFLSWNDHNNEMQIIQRQDIRTHRWMLDSNSSTQKPIKHPFESRWLKYKIPTKDYSHSINYIANRHNETNHIINSYLEHSIYPSINHFN